MVIGICTPNCAFSFGAKFFNRYSHEAWVVVLTANEVVLRLVVANIVVDVVAALIDERKGERLLGLHQRRRPFGRKMSVF